MKKLTSGILLLLLFAVIVSCGQKQPKDAVGLLAEIDKDSAPNTLTPGEKKDGWQLLFDGKTTNGWKAAGQEKFPSEGWKVVDGTMMAVANTRENPVKGIDIVSDEKFSAFELQFEFNFTEGANSGVKYFTGNGGPSIGL